MRPKGKGHVLLFSTNPVYRWQNLGEFNMLANALLKLQRFAGSAGAAGVGARRVRRTVS
jgi:hypothetical protein